ncbi:MAG: ATP-binding protein [Deltaproteobacteria bacterium]|nr:ATP-binding protein [Deltaproteobacteria bacterium]
MLLSFPTTSLRQETANRYESGSLIVTSNQPFSQWDQTFPDALMTVAAVDRIVHHASIIEIEGEIVRIGEMRALKRRYRENDHREWFE